MITEARQDVTFRLGAELFGLDVGPFREVLETADQVREPVLTH